MKKQITVLTLCAMLFARCALAEAQRLVLGVGVGVLLFSVLFSSSLVDAASAPRRIVIVFAGFDERTGVLFVAKDHRLFEEEGLEADIVQARSGPIAVSALATGDAKFYVSGLTGAILGAMAGGLDVVFIAGFINKLDGYVVVSPNIQRPVDLKGKILGVQSIGGGLWMRTMMTLDYWGLNPEQDKIQFRILGDQSVVAQSILKGIIDGAFLDHIHSKMLERQGYRILANITEVGVPHQGTAVLARRSFVDQSPEIAEKSLRVFSKAVAFFHEPANKQAVMKSLAKWLRLPRVEDAEAGYETMRALYSRRLFPTVAGLRNGLRVLSKVNPKLLGLKPEDLMEDRLLKKLEQEGR